jgi:hypothetical protein
VAYRGIAAKLPLGSQGFTGTRNPTQAGPGHLTFVDGAELDGGIIRKEGGAKKLNAAALLGGAAIVSGISWSPTPAGYNDIVFLSTGVVRKDTGAGTFSIQVASGLTDFRDPAPVFVAAGGETVGQPRKLFMFSSSNQVRVLPGTSNTMAAITSPAADWAGIEFPTFGAQHGLRVFAGGNDSDPHRLYYSTISDHADYLGAGSGTLAIYPGEGERLVGAISFRGALVLFKYPLGIYVLDTPDATPANWSLSRLSRSVGTLSQHTIVQIENDVLYMDHAGNIHILSATQEFGDMNTSNLSKIATLEPFMRTDVERLRIRRSVGIWYASKRQAWFAVPLLGSVVPNLRIMIGFDQQQQGGQGGPGLPRFFMSRRDVAISMWTRPHQDKIPKPVVGDDAGFVWLLDEDARNKDGNAYQIRFETANTDLSFIDETLATKMKAGQFLELTSEPRGDWDLTVEVYWDDALQDVLQYAMGSSGAALGEFTLDIDTLGSEVVASQRKRLVGSGRRIKLIAYNNGVDQDVSLAEFHLSFNVMDERIRE